MGVIPAFVARMEKKVSTNIYLVAYYSRQYREVILNEVSLAGINSRDLVLNIGCGGIPYTALSIASYTGARVCAIDRDEEAIRAAHRCIKSLKMGDKVTALAGDGSDNLPVKFDVAIVALQAEPKKEILENLIMQSKPGARLIFRSPRHKSLNQYDSLPVAPVPSAKINQNKTTFNYSVLYEVPLNGPKCQNLGQITSACS